MFCEDVYMWKYPVIFFWAIIFEHLNIFLYLCSMNQVKFIMKKCLILLTIAFLAFASCDNKTQKLYRIQENGLYGFIDSLGNVIITPQYKYVDYFTEDGYACVISDIKIEKDEAALPKQGLDIDVDSCIRVTYGYINRKNELVVDTTNHIYIPAMSLQNWENHGLVRFAHDYRDGELLFGSSIFSELSFCDGLYVFQDEKSKLYGYKDIQGNIKIEAQYYYCHSFKNGVAVVNYWNKTLDNVSNLDATKAMNCYGLIDPNGNMLSKDFTIINDMGHNGQTWAMTTTISLEGKDIKKDWVLIDKHGKIVAGPIPGVDMIYNNDEFPVCEINMGILGTFYTFLDEHGNFLSDFDHNKELDLGWDNNGKSEVFALVTRFENGVAGLKGYNSEGQSAWFFIKKDFIPVTEPYDSLLPFSEGLAAVKELTHLDGISTHGGKWGFVKIDMPDSTITQTIPFGFSECGSFSGGLAYFKNEGATFDLEGYINKQGNIVWQTKRKK